MNFLPDVTYGYIIFYLVQPNVLKKNLKIFPGINKPQAVHTVLHRNGKTFIIKIVNTY